MRLNRFIFSLMQIKQKIRRNTYEQEFQAIVCSASSRDWHHRIKFQGFIFFLNLPFSASNMPAGSGTAQLNSISQIAGKQKQIAPKCSIAVMIHDSGNSKQLFHSSDKKWPLSKKKKEALNSTSTPHKHTWCVLICLSFPQHLGGTQMQRLNTAFHLSKNMHQWRDDNRGATECNAHFPEALLQWSLTPLLATANSFKWANVVWHSSTHLPTAPRGCSPRSILDLLLTSNSQWF